MSKEDIERLMDVCGKNSEGWDSIQTYFQAYLYLHQTNEYVCEYHPYISALQYDINFAI